MADAHSSIRRPSLSKREAVLGHSSATGISLRQKSCLGRCDLSGVHVRHSRSVLRRRSSTPRRWSPRRPGAPANAREHVAFQTGQPVLGVLLVAPRGPLLFKHPCGGVLAGAFPRSVQPDTRRDTPSPTRSSCPRASTPRAPKRVRRQAGAPASPCRSLGRDPR